jgi:hypothetical protein
MKHYAMKTYGGVDVQIHVFLTSKLYGDEWSSSRPMEITAGVQWIGGWMGRRVSLGSAEYRNVSWPLRK